MGKHFSKEFKEMVVSDYKTGNYGGHMQVAKKYNIMNQHYGIGLLKIGFKEIKTTT